MRRVLLVCLLALAAVPVARAAWPDPEFACGDGQQQWVHADEPNRFVLWCVEIPDRRPFSVEITREPEHGTVTVGRPTAEGFAQVTYTGPPGQDSFAYSATSASGRTATGSVILLAGTSNLPPYCANPGFAPQVPATRWIGCRDWEGDPLTYEVVQRPKHGTLTLDQQRGVLEWTPATPYQEAADSATLRVRDDRGGDVRVPVEFNPDWWWPQCSPPGVTEVRADQPTAVTLHCPAGVEIRRPPARGTVTTRDEGDYTLLTYAPDATTTSDYVDAVVFRSKSGRSPDYMQRFAVRRVRPAVALDVPAQRLRQVLRRGLVASVGCVRDCRFTATVRIGTRDIVSVPGTSGAVTLPLDRAAKRQLRRSRRPALRVAIVPEGFRRPTVTWAELSRG